MADPFVGEIRIFGFQFAPRGWAFCDGQLMAISQNTALFSLLGVTYGGDGRSTFGLPNFQGRAPLAPGQGPGLSPYGLGQIGGSETATLSISQVPQHSHTLNATSANGSQTTSTGAQLARGFRGNLQSSRVAKMYSNVAPTTQMSPTALAEAGGGQPHNNMMPYLTLNFCIALQGVFPPRP